MSLALGGGLYDVGFSHSLVWQPYDAETSLHVHSVQCTTCFSLNKMLLMHFSQCLKVSQSSNKAYSHAEGLQSKRRTFW